MLTDLTVAESRVLAERLDRWPERERGELAVLARDWPGEALVVAELVALLDARPVV